MTAAVPIRLNIRYDMPGLFATVRDKREVLRAAWADAGLKWHQEYLPRHFKPGAAFRYGYRPRTNKYLARKVRDARVGKATEGGTTPLVYSGLFKRSVTGLATVRGFPSRFTVYMNAPSYVPQKSRDQKQPPLAEEVTRMVPSEATSLANYLASRITYHNNRVRRRRQVRIS